MKKTPLATPPPPFGAIHTRAYHLWQHANRPIGQDMEFWLQAEQQVMQPQIIQQPQARAAATTAPAKAPSNTKAATKTPAKANPQTALTFKPKPGAKRSTKPPAR